MKLNAEVKRFEALLAEGYGRWDDNDPVGACGPWLEAWPLFLRLIDEAGSQSIRGFDKAVSPEWLTFNWVQDLEATI